MQRAEERAEAGENKIVDLEEELRVIGENLKVSVRSMRILGRVGRARSSFCCTRPWR